MHTCGGSSILKAELSMLACPRPWNGGRWHFRARYGGRARDSVIDLDCPPDALVNVNETLEHLHLLCSVSGANKEAFAACDGNGLEALFR